MAWREDDIKEGEDFPNQNKMLALCLLNSLSLSSCFGVLKEGDRQRAISVLIFISPPCPFHLYLWTRISRRESFGISPSCHPAPGCDQSRAARKLEEDRVCMAVFIKKTKWMKSMLPPGLLFAPRPVPFESRNRALWFQSWMHRHMNGNWNS